MKRLQLAAASFRSPHQAVNWSLLAPVFWRTRATQISRQWQLHHLWRWPKLQVTGCCQTGNPHAQVDKLGGHNKMWILNCYNKMFYVGGRFYGPVSGEEIIHNHVIYISGIAILCIWSSCIFDGTMKLWNQVHLHLHVLYFSYFGGNRGNRHILKQIRMELPVTWKPTCRWTSWLWSLMMLGKVDRWWFYMGLWVTHLQPCWARTTCGSCHLSSTCHGRPYGWKLGSLRSVVLYILVFRLNTVDQNWIGSNHQKINP